MSSFELLINEHEMLARASLDLEKTLQRGVKGAESAIAALDRLSTLLEDHLSREDDELYPRLMQCGNSKTAQMAEDFAVSFLALRNDWMRYLDRWSLRPDPSNWTSFCAETRSILTRLEERIGQENTLLYPAALEASVITLRARAA